MTATGSYDPHRETAWWATVCLCATEAAFFAYLITAYFYLSTRSPHWPPSPIPLPSLGLPLVMTAILLSSSGAISWGERGIRLGRRRQLIAGLSLSLLLGAVFVLLLGVEWHGKLDVMRPGTHVYASLFYLITGMHGLHLVIGLALIGYTLVRAVLGHFAAQRHTGVAVVALYWHFVDLVWLAVATTLYISPRFR
jgi:cytochrome c oxidase subunit 3